MTTYKISYKYVRPSPAGPFKGKDISTTKYKKGEHIYAVFGLAEVVSCREIKQKVKELA